MSQHPYSFWLETQTGESDHCISKSPSNGPVGGRVLNIKPAAVDIAAVVALMVCNQLDIHEGWLLHMGVEVIEHDGI